MKNCEVLKTVFLLLGTIVGAGFASGKEIIIFFGPFCFSSLINILICGVVFFLVCYMFLNCNNKCNFYYFQKAKVSTFFEIIMIFCLIFTISTLTAALNSTIGFFASALSFALILFIVLMGIGFLKNVNFVLMPIIIVVLVFISFWSVGNGSFSQTSLKPLLFNSFLYVGMNIFLASEVLIDSSKVLTKKQKLLSAIFSSILFVAILICITVGFSYGNITTFDEMPILSLALGISPILSKIYVFVLWASVFTTLASVVYSLKAKIKKNFNWGNKALILFCCFSLLLSLFGFENIIKIFYPFEGFVGIIYCLIIFVLIFAAEGRQQKKH